MRAENLEEGNVSLTAYDDYGAVRQKCHEISV